MQKKELLIYFFKRYSSIKFTKDGFDNFTKYIDKENNLEFLWDLSILLYKKSASNLELLILYFNFNNEEKIKMKFKNTILKFQNKPYYETYSKEFYDELKKSYINQNKVVSPLINSTRKSYKLPTIEDKMKGGR